MNWQNKDTYQEFTHDFESFDSAWEFMNFLAKLSRSTHHQPHITNHGSNVSIQVSDNQTSKDYIAGVNAYFTDEKDRSVVSNTISVHDAVLYADGGSRGNPGPSASGFALYDKDQNEIARGGEFLGVTTNNQAEYHSLKAGIEKALELHVKKLKVNMDSMLVVNQIKGTYKVRNRDLWPIYESLKENIAHFQSFEIAHIPRELNKVADSIVNQILDEQTH